MAQATFPVHYTGSQTNSVLNLLNCIDNLDIQFRHEIYALVCKQADILEKAVMKEPNFAANIYDHLAAVLFLKQFSEDTGSHATDEENASLLQNGHLECSITQKQNDASSTSLRANQ